MDSVAASVDWDRAAPWIEIGRHSGRVETAVIGARFTVGMSGRSSVEMRAARRSAEIRRGLGRDVRVLREDAGLATAVIARAAHVHPVTIGRLESGSRLPRLPTLARIADALGADLSVRIVPGAGIPVRDRAQSWMVEAFLRALHSAWRPELEVAVVTPARGVIDMVLRRADGGAVVAVEFQSELRRVEQVIRWSAEKAMGVGALSSVRHPDGTPATVHRLLVLRSSPATRAVVRSLDSTFATAYPVPARDAVESLRAGWPLPGSAIVWMEVRGRATHLLAGPPRDLLRRNRGPSRGAELPIGPTGAGSPARPSGAGSPARP